MELVTWAVPLLYYGFVLALSTYLLIRGITHLFVPLFAVGALLELMRTLGFMILQRGGFAENMHLVPIVSLVGTIGMLLSGGAFVALAAFLLRTATSKPPPV
jgi:hypothetical protein